MLCYLFIGNLIFRISYAYVLNELVRWQYTINYCNGICSWAILFSEFHIVINELIRWQYIKLLLLSVHGQFNFRISNEINELIKWQYNKLLRYVILSWSM